MAKKQTEVFYINKKDLQDFFRKNLGILLKLLDKKFFIWVSDSLYLWTCEYEIVYLFHYFFCF